MRASASIETALLAEGELGAEAFEPGGQPPYQLETAVGAEMGLPYLEQANADLLGPLRVDRKVALLEYARLEEGFDAFEVGFGLAHFTSSSRGSRWAS